VFAEVLFPVSVFMWTSLHHHSWFSYCVSRYYSPSCFYLKQTTFKRFSLWGFASCCVHNLNRYRYRLMQLLFIIFLYFFFLLLHVSTFSTIIKWYWWSRKLSNYTMDPLFLDLLFIISCYALFLFPHSLII
jgi:hypothetical protein